jgi:hypothetical protein
MDEVDEEESFYIHTVALEERGDLPPYRRLLRV